jgi:hypothetical protein
MRTVGAALFFDAMAGPIDLFVAPEPLVASRIAHELKTPSRNFCSCSIATPIK